ncbi:MAG TPA: DUF4861 family protein [Edaphobacter sp.]|nr:DUF4861 family protein [Edaphobacter sp.]
MILHGAALATLLPSLMAQQPSPWLLPNFSDRLELQVSNPADEAVDTLAIIPVSKAAQTALRFPGTMAIVVIPGSPITILPSQADDLNGDGVPDEFVFPMKMKARARMTVDVYYSTTLHDGIPWPRQVYATHSFGYNRSTVALESEIIGYRTYGGFFLDVQARERGKPGLNNNLVGYLSASASAPSPAGKDILHIGDTLGLGGLFLRSGKDVFRPPLNVPDYAHKPSPPEVPSYRVIADGPVRAVVEAWMDHWSLGNDAVSIDAIYSIAAGAEGVECRFKILPLSLSHTYEVGIGIRHLPKMRTDDAPGRLALEGEQEAAMGPLGLAVYFDKATISRTGTLKTQDDDNSIAVFGTQLKPGHAVSGHYWLAADWSGSGIHDLLGHLHEVQRQTQAHVVIDNFKHDRTPKPARLEGEAY